MIVIRKNTFQPFHPFLFPEHAALAFGAGCHSQPSCQKEEPCSTPNSSNTKENDKSEDAESPNTNASPAKPTKDSVPTQFIRPAYLHDANDKFVLTIDLPGVRVIDLAITEENCQLTIRAERQKQSRVVAKYARTFALDQRTIDRENIQATLTNGVLTLDIPKMPLPDKVALVPTAGKDAPEEITNDKSKFFSMSLDLPGVKPSDLRVTLTPHREIEIQAQRQRTNSSSSLSRIRRIFSITENVNINTSQAELFLNDGVMTLVAPLQDNQSCSAGARTIPVNSVSPTREKDASSLEAEKEENKVKIEPAVEQGIMAKEDGTAEKEETCENKEAERDEELASDFVEVETVTPGEEEE